MTTASGGARTETGPPSRRPNAPASSETAARLDCLDGWRGLAIALVLIGHFVPLAGWSLDSVGVDLFFVLSGRLIAGILFADVAPLGSFVWRRLARVAPSLVVFVLLVGPLHAMLGRPMPDLVAPLTFTANYVYAAAGEPVFFGHLWSLCVEEHSYLALVLIALAARRCGGGALAIVTLLGLACLADLAVSEILLGQRDFAVLWRTDARAASLILSGAMHLFARERLRGWSRRRGFRAVPLAALMAGLALHHAGIPQVVQYSFGGLFLAVAVNTIEAAPQSVLGQLTSPPLRHLARWSYSIYLWQQPFFVVACLADPAWRLPMLAAATGAGLVNFRLVEQPARRRLNGAWTLAGRRPGPFRKPVSDGAA